MKKQIFTAITALSFVAGSAAFAANGPGKRTEIERGRLDKDGKPVDARAAEKEVGGTNRASVEASKGGMTAEQIKSLEPLKGVLSGGALESVKSVYSNLSPAKQKLVTGLAVLEAVKSNRGYADLVIPQIASLEAISKGTEPRLTSKIVEKLINDTFTATASTNTQGENTIEAANGLIFVLNVMAKKPELSSKAAFEAGLLEFYKSQEMKKGLSEVDAAKEADRRLKEAKESKLLEQCNPGRA